MNRSANDLRHRLRAARAAISGLISKTVERGTAARRVLAERRLRLRRERERFPVRWLTFKRRLHLDVEDAYGAAPEIFNQGYLEYLDASVKQIDGWLIRLYLVQLSISFILVLGLISTEKSVSIFGVTMQDATALKELLLSIAASTTLLFALFAHVRDVRIEVSEKIARLRNKGEFVDLALLGTPAAFNSRIYVTRPYRRWIFSSWFSKGVRITFAFLGILIVTSLFALSIGLYVYVIIDIYNNPTLPNPWSYLAIVFVISCFVFGILALVVQHAPLPYIDNQRALDAERLKETDPVEYQKRIAELYRE